MTLKSAIACDSNENKTGILAEASLSEGERILARALAAALAPMPPAPPPGGAPPRPPVCPCAMLTPSPGELPPSHRRERLSPYATCQFIAGDARAGAAYCGVASQPGSSFCPEHHALCYLHPDGPPGLPFGYGS